jgi:hypothetical protein
MTSDLTLAQCRDLARWGLEQTLNPHGDEYVGFYDDPNGDGTKLSRHVRLVARKYERECKRNGYEWKLGMFEPRPARNGFKR